MNRTHITRAGLLLALLLAVQSLRLLIPLPPFITMFGIGSAVNACLLVASLFVGIRTALLMAVVAPTVAYLQQMLPVPVLIVPVAAANAVYVLAFAALYGKRPYLAVVVAALVKMAGMYVAIDWVLQFVALPERIAALLRMMLSWPQLVTGLLGGALCLVIVERLRKTGLTKTGG